MTLPQNVKDADEEMVAAGGEIIWRHYPAIRAHLMSQEAEISKTDRILRSSVPHRWKSAESPIACVQNHIAELESRLAAANALLRFMRIRFDAYMDASDRAAIDAATQESTT